jgi:GrpB-like predicted nucleotidyltransferase (UPF0157 family)
VALRAELATRELVRNVAFALLGVAALVLKPLYGGPGEYTVYSYGGNFSVSFALYFVALTPLGRRGYGRLAAALLTLTAVQLFEITDGFGGAMGNTYDPWDLLANVAGVGFAVVVDLLTSPLVERRDRPTTPEGLSSGDAPDTSGEAPDRATIERLVAEEVEVVPYDPRWPERFREEEAHLRSILPAELVGRIEHFGSTAVPGLAAKPVVDILVEVRDLDEAKRLVVPVLEEEGYEYVWRPTHGDDGGPWYAWFIKRDAETGARTHHLHMVEPGFTEHWDRLLFRDYLLEHPEAAAEYAELKRRLASASPDDRAAYTAGKSEFIDRVTECAKEERRP